MWNDKTKAAILGLWLWLPSLAVLSTDQVQGAGAIFSLLAFSLMLLAAPLVLVARPRSYFLLLSPFALLVAPYVYLTLAYHSVPGDALVSASLSSNLSLTLSVLASFGAIVWLVPFSWLAYVLLAWSLRRDWRLSPDHRKRLLAGLLVYALVGLGGRQLMAHRIQLPPMMEYSTASLAFPSGLALSLQRLHTKRADARHQASVQARSLTGNEPLLVTLVLGESLRADHLGLNGYGRNTTPLLSAMGSSLISFTDVASTANWTDSAVAPLISWQAEGKNVSVVETFREAGFRIAWLSNQNSYWPAHSADVVEYGVDTQDLRYRTDANLLPMFSSFVRQAGPRQFVVLHMHGSHIPYEDRYDASSRVFTPTMKDLGISRPGPADKAAAINSYDNTVIETDKFLARVIGELGRETRPAIMLFTSDHGENLFDDERGLWMHTQRGPTRADLQVPLLVWTNAAYRQRFPGVMAALQANRTRKLSHRQVFPTLMDLGRVAWNGSDPRHSFATQQFEESKRTVQYDLERQVDFDSLR